MLEQGIVSKIQENIITVNCQISELCASCETVNKCKTYGTKKQTRYFKALNNKNFKLKIDDKVLVYLSPAKTVGAGFLIFILPLILFCLIYLASEYLIHNIPEYAKVLFGFIGIAFGFIIVFLKSHFSNKKDYPEIIKVIDKDN